MTFHSEFDPFAVSQHNRGLHEEIKKRRIEKRLRGMRRPQSRSGSNFRRMLMRLR